MGGAWACHTHLHLTRVVIDGVSVLMSSVLWLWELGRWAGLRACHTHLYLLEL